MTFSSNNKIALNTLITLLAIGLIVYYFMPSGEEHAPAAISIENAIGKNQPQPIKLSIEERNNEINNKLAEFEEDSINDKVIFSQLYEDQQKLTLMIESEGEYVPKSRPKTNLSHEQINVPELKSLSKQIAESKADFLKRIARQTGMDTEDIYSLFDYESNTLEELQGDNTIEPNSEVTLSLKDVIKKK